MTGQQVRSTGARNTAPDEPATIVAAVRGARRSMDAARAETRDGRVLVHCFAGCSQDAVIGALKAADLWPGGRVVGDPSYPGYLTTPADGMTNRDERRRREAARTIWAEAAPIAGTLGERYLRSRGITAPLPPTLRFARLRHRPDGRIKPAIVCALQDGSNRVTAVHRGGGNLVDRLALENEFLRALGNLIADGVRVLAAENSPRAFLKLLRNLPTMKQWDAGEIRAAKDRLIAKGRLARVELGPPSKRETLIRPADYRYPGEDA